METQGPLSSDGLVQLLTHDGARVENAEYSRFIAHLTPERLRAMWRDMTLTRAFDNEATSLQRQGELGLWVQSLGQEAAQVGSGHALRPTDWAFPSYREHGVAQVRGVKLSDLLKPFRGIDHASWVPKDHNFHIYTLVIGSQTLHATGFAMAMDRDGKVASHTPETDGAVVTYFGDGATAQGDVSEALVFAAVNNAPVVFFCQNNQFAISEPTTHQSRVPLARRGEGFGIPGVRVDGNDVLASYAVTAAALERARTGGGPTFVEAFTYRMGAHTTSDDPSRYRSKADEDFWKTRDPITRLTKYLTSIGELSQEFQDEVAAEAAALSTQVRTDVRGWTAPPTLRMFEHVYAEPHATVEAEREWFAAYERSFVDVEAQG